MKPRNAVPSLALAAVLAVLSALSCTAGGGDATASFFISALSLAELLEAVDCIRRNILINALCRLEVECYETNR